jgi:antitoxin (DNA-binding transcriptional repressor) of toxin-antitoxin stability system
MRQVSVEEAQAQFLLLIESALKGEEIIITQADQPILKFVAIDSPKPRRQPGRGKHLMITMSDDFDEPLADFAEYMR